jgi:hypothetical protein
MVLLKVEDVIIASKVVRATNLRAVSSPCTTGSAVSDSIVAISVKRTGLNYDTLKPKGESRI